jgi:hypothetical protein
LDRKPMLKSLDHILMFVPVGSRGRGMVFLGIAAARRRAFSRAEKPLVWLTR